MCNQDTTNTLRSTEDGVEASEAFVGEMLLVGRRVVSGLADRVQCVGVGAVDGEIADVMAEDVIGGDLLSHYRPEGMRWFEYLDQIWNYAGVPTRPRVAPSSVPTPEPLPLPLAVTSRSAPGPVA